MEITLTLSDDIAKQIQNLQQQAKEPWAKIAQRIHTDPVHLAAYSQQLKKDMREFRENFTRKNSTTDLGNKRIVAVPV